jgi:hypothetical protein
MTHPITLLQEALVAAWRADAALGVPVFDAPPKGQAGSYVAIVRHDIRARDGDLAPGYEHRVLLHVWHDQPSRAAALEIVEKLVAAALAAESTALAVTFRQHAGTDTVIDTKTGRARAAVTLRFFTEPTT